MNPYPHITFAEVLQSLCTKINSFQRMFTKMWIAENERTVFFPLGKIIRIKITPCRLSWLVVGHSLIFQIWKETTDLSLNSLLSAPRWCHIFSVLLFLFFPSCFVTLTSYTGPGVNCPLHSGLWFVSCSSRLISSACFHSTASPRHKASDVKTTLFCLRRDVFHLSFDPANTLFSIISSCRRVRACLTKASMWSRHSCCQV